MLILNNINSQKKILSFNFDHNIDGQIIKFYSCNFSLIKVDNNFIANFRCVNYVTEPTFILPLNNFITINVKIIFDINFNIIEKEYYAPDNYNKNLAFIGVEDIRLFRYNNDILYTGAISLDNYLSNKNGVICSNYNNYCNNPNDIYITNLENRKTVEKNWVYFEMNNELFVVYEWHPLTICKIIDNKLVIEKKYNLTEFIDIRGSSNGIVCNNEIWFITHKCLGSDRTFKHYIIIFDLKMNFIRMSIPFKFENNIREYCICLYTENNNIYIGYSTNDNTSILNIYDKDILSSALKI